MTRFDRWSRDNMPGDSELAKINRGIAETMCHVIVSRNISQSASMIPPQQRAAEEPRPASGGTVPITPPPGIDNIDRIAESFARQDRIAAIRQAAENAEIERRLVERKKDPYRCQTEYDSLAKYDDEVGSCHREKEE
jgi:hypothetical protein